MYGLIGKLTAVPGQREALIAILLEGSTGMPGCLSYVVVRDPAEQLAEAISQAVSDGDLRQRAASLVETLRAEDGVGHAVAFINRQTQ